MDIFQNPGLMHYKNFIKDIANSMADSIGSIVNEKQLESDATGIVIFETLLSNVCFILHLYEYKLRYTIIYSNVPYADCGSSRRHSSIRYTTF